MGLGNEYPEADEASHRHLYELSQQRVKTLEEDRKYWRERAYSLDLEREQLSIDCDTLLQTVADLQSRVTVAEQRAQDRQEQLEQVRKHQEDRDEIVRSIIGNSGLVESEGSMLGMVHSITDLAKQRCLDADTLRTELASARQQAQTERSEAAEDTALLDWLLQFITQNGANGIENMQWSLEDPEEIMEDRMGLVFDRKCIDAARHAAGTTKEEK